MRRTSLVSGFLRVDFGDDVGERDACDCVDDGGDYRNRVVVLVWSSLSSLSFSSPPLLLSFSSPPLLFGVVVVVVGVDVAVIVTFCEYSRAVGDDMALHIYT